MGAASGRQLREASEKAHEPSGGGRSDCKGPSVGRHQWGSFQGWLEGDEGQKLTPTGKVVEFVAEIDQD